MNKPTRVAMILVLVILLLIGGVYGFRAYANGRKLDALQMQAAEMFSQPRDSSSSGNSEQRREGYREMRQQVEALPEAYQQQFRQSMSSMFMQREERRMDEYLSLSKVERKKYLDKQIVEGERRRKEWEARRKQYEAERAKQASAGGNADNGENAGRQGNNGGNGNRWRGGWSQSARLDRTSPEFRAKRAEYRRDMEQRRKELGLPQGGWGRR
jgi:hypothetical protein